MKVLAVDDNPDILKLVQMTVESLGHSFESASGGIAGLNLLRDNKYDMVLLDLAMPDITGLEVIDALIKEDIMNKQRVVLFTASYLGMEDLQTKIEEKGVHTILPKPADIDQIVDLLQKIESEINSA